MGVAISRSLLDAIRADLALDPSRERCGLLLGGAGWIGGLRISGWLPARNIHPSPEHAFELDPAVLLGAMRAARAGGEAVIGHVHSHPHGAARPSRADAAAAEADGRLWMIVDADGDVGLWQSSGNGPVHGMFVGVDLVPD